MHDHLPQAALTFSILKCCFDVMRELGAGFLEAVYKNALIMALKQAGLSSDAEKSFEVYFRQEKIGLYVADLIVERTVVVELKCCQGLLPEHQAQTINYLAAAKLPVGLLINFGRRNLEYKRVHHPLFYPAAAGNPENASFLGRDGDPAREADPVPYLKSCT